MGSAMEQAKAVTGVFGAENKRMVVITWRYGGK